MEYGDTSSESLASAITSLLSAAVDYRAIREDSVDRAADRLAELL